MKKLLLLSLLPLLLVGCVSNQAFRSEKARVDELESTMAQNRTELGVLRKEIMQDRRSGGSGSSAELEAMMTVVREISETQITQNALLQEDIAYLMDRISSTAQEAGSTDPQMAMKLNSLAVTLEQTTTTMNSKISAIQNELSELKAGNLGTASGTVTNKEIAALQSQMEANRKAQAAEITAIKEAMAGTASQGTVKHTTVPSSSTAGISSVEQSEYEAARLEYNNGNYQKAIRMLDAFVARFPNSDYAGNATYWKGESRYAMSEYSAALQEFQAVVSRYPNSWKVADSQLKIGMCHVNMGDSAKARTALNQLKRDYPYYGRMDLVDIYLNKLK